jgi:hypothetical protein
MEAQMSVDDCSGGNGKDASTPVAVLANSQQVAQSFRYPLTIRRQLDILYSNPWLAGIECNSII